MSARTRSQCLLNTVGMIQKTQMRFVKVASKANLHFLMSGERLAFPSSSFPHSPVAIALPHYCPFQHVHHARVDTRQRATGLSKSFSLLQSWSLFQGQGRPTLPLSRVRAPRVLQVAVISQAAQCESDYYCQCSTIGLLTLLLPLIIDDM
jgi:hypothetical protein